MGAVVGETCKESLAKRENPCPWCLAPKAMKTMELQHLVVEANGIIWDAYWIPIEPDLYLHFAFDITKQHKTEVEKKKLEEQLIQSQKMESIGRLAGGIAHDFNNILTSIMGYAELLKLQFPDENSSEGEAADVILRGAERASNLTQQLLGFARKGRFNPKPLNVNVIIKETVEVSEKIFEKKIRVDFNLDKNIDTVEADGRQLDQVLTNLIINAKDAMPTGGSLTFKTENIYLDQDIVSKFPELLPGKYVKISVMDTGTGIPKKIIDDVFEPFFSTKGEGKGTGLGLATVYGIIKNHNGHIHVASEPGKSTTFTIYLPVTLEKIAKQRKKFEIYKGSGTVLIVDDEAPVRQIASIMLRGFGYEIIPAENGIEAIQIFRDNIDRIDLVLLDIIMPEMDGIQTLRELRKIDPTVKVVLSSGYSKDDKAAELVTDGAASFIQKPYKRDELSKVVIETMNL